MAVRILQRWTGPRASSRENTPKTVRPGPAHALSEAEGEEILRIANELCFGELRPARVVPIRAEEGVCIASESSCGCTVSPHQSTP